MLGILARFAICGSYAVSATRCALSAGIASAPWHACAILRGRLKIRKGELSDCGQYPTGLASDMPPGSRTAECDQLTREAADMVAARRLQLERTGAALFGAEWVSPLARALRVNIRTAQRWASGEITVPESVVRDALAALVRDIGPARLAAAEQQAQEVRALLADARR